MKKEIEPLQVSISKPSQKLNEKFISKINEIIEFIRPVGAHIHVWQCIPLVGLKCEICGIIKENYFK